MHDLPRGKDCMKKFCKSSRKHAIKIIILKNKKNRFINKRAS